jgi:hypothetical protein
MSGLVPFQISAYKFYVIIYKSLNYVIEMLME